MRAVRLTLTMCALGLAAQAQFGGQYPGQYPPGGYPPGGYPPGRYPPNGGPNGQPVPNGQPRTSRQGRTSTPAPVEVTTAGLLRVSAGNQFVLEADDHRIITYRVSSKTAVQKQGKDADIASMAPGDHLEVDSTEDDQGYLTAVSVRFDKSGTPAERAAAAETWDLPKLDRALGAASSAPSSPPREPGDDRPVLRRKTDDQASPTTGPATAEAPSAKTEPEEPVDTRPTTTMRPPDPKPDADDPGPPSLRRGAPPAQRAGPLPPPGSAGSLGSPVTQSKPPQPAAGPASILTETNDDAVIRKAKEAAAGFSGALPNFFCQQVTTRYQSEHPRQGWDALDVVTADVAYEDGRESYKNIKVGNKVVNKAMEDIEGTRSTGEFASMQGDLLSPETGAQFRPAGQDTIHGRATWVYKYEVPRERSHWRIETTAQLYYPAYQGTIWIDRETSRILRIEQQTRNMPRLFPFDTVETANDYDFVRLSTTEPFLLPVDAEVLSCIRGTSHCSRNRIEFRNYRKFEAESSVTFDPN